MSNYHEETGLSPFGKFDADRDGRDDLRLTDIERMSATVLTTEEWFKRHRADEITRNLSYVRGKFWEGDGLGIDSSLHENYEAARNEIFPIVDTIVSALAMDLPQVEALDRRQMSYAYVGRHEDSFYSGARQASVLNWFAEEDALDVTVREIAMHAEVFDEGGLVKTQWSPNLGRVIWRSKLPWEVFFDPTAKRVEDAGYAFERFVLHADEYDALLKSTYDKPKRELKPEIFPRTIIDERMQQDDEDALKQKGLREYIQLVEFWDFRRRMLYHLEPKTRQILMATPIPYGNPYSLLIPHPGIGRIRGVSDVSLMAPVQRDINELAAARREVVNRLPRRMLIDRGMFKTELEFERFKNAKTWEPTLVTVPPDRNLADGVFVTPEMPTTFDFNQHFNQDIDHIRWLPGLADYTRGAKQHFRTAEEASMVRSATEGRLNIRMQQLKRVVQQMFVRAREATRWAIRNPQVSNIDLPYIHAMTQSDVDLWTLRRDLIDNSPKFTLLPFSPLMEDRVARRHQLGELVDRFNSTPMAEWVDWQDLTRQTQELHNLRPSMLKAPTQGDQALNPAPAAPQPQAPAGPPAPPPGLGNVLRFGRG